MTNPTLLTLSASETAVALKVTPPTIYAWIRSGEIPSVRLGGRVRIPVAPLAKLLGVDVETVVYAVGQDAAS